jgi:glucuronate isomerase
MTTARPILTRALSAHTSHMNQRPFSANTVTFSRKELIENAYTMQPHTSTGRAISAKTLGTIAAAGIEKTKKIVVKQSKKRE